MPTVPVSTQSDTNPVTGAQQGITPANLLMAAATMHGHGRLVEEEPQVPLASSGPVKVHGGSKPGQRRGPSVSQTRK